MSDLDASINYLAEATGYDLYDELDTAQFQLYLEKAISIFNRNSFIQNSNESKIEESRIICNEFHTLCEDGRFENNRKNVRNNYIR